jgi:hypothetical protein
VVSQWVKLKAGITIGQLCLTIRPESTGPFSTELFLQGLRAREDECQKPKYSEADSADPTQEIGAQSQSPALALGRPGAYGALELESKGRLSSPEVHYPRGSYENLPEDCKKGLESGKGLVATGAEVSYRFPIAIFGEMIFGDDPIS